MSEHFTIAVTHSSRPVEPLTCSLNALTRRYGDSERLVNPPLFAGLPGMLEGGFFSYSGGLSLLDLRLDERGAHVGNRSFSEPLRKIQHAAWVGSRLVLCFEDCLYLCDGKTLAATPREAMPDDPARQIHDPWFAGLHTVFPIDDHRCLVSSSAADAVLEVDLDARVVTRRLRLPSEIYGLNYALGPNDSLRDHYVHNDLQVGHLNCAVPDGEGGAFVSSLIPGDIGRFDKEGRYRVLHSGAVGCHGIRTLEQSDRLYFADSALGLLVLMERSGKIVRRYQTGSRWLHDVQHVSDALYLLALGDHNALALVDIERDRELLRIGMAGQGRSVQFLNLVRNAGG